MSLTNKSLKDTYGDLLELDNSNSGVTSTARVIKDGSGTSSSLKLGTNGVQITPGSNGNSFIVENAAGTDMLLVDTTNSCVKAGNGANRYVNTNNLVFSGFNINGTAGNHEILDRDMPFGSGITFDLGSGADPATSLAISATYGLFMSKFFYVPYDIVLDGGKVFASADDDNNANVLFHLMSYDISLGNGSTATYGDLSNGVVVADHSALTNVCATHMCSTNLTIQSSNVTAGKVLIATVETDNSDNIYAKLSVNYHYK